MTERELWGLRGAVRTCRCERTWYSRQCGPKTCEVDERSDTAFVGFRAEGCAEQRWHHNPDGSEWTATYEYDELGRLTVMRTDDGSGRVDLTAYEYDAAGRLAQVIARRQKGMEHVVERYRYDAAGRKTKIVYVDIAAQRSDTVYSWGVEGTDAIYSAPGVTAMLETLYNERDKPAEFLFYDGAGALLSRVQFRYDLSGNLVEEVQTHVAEMMPQELLLSLNPAQLETVRGLFGSRAEPIRRTHEYDEQGRRVGTHLTMGLLGHHSKTVFFNDQGDPVSEISEDEHNEYGMDDGGQLSALPTKNTLTRFETRFYYEYDAHGNWTRKTVESRGAEQEFFLCSIERRTIQYFD